MLEPGEVCSRVESEMKRLERGASGCEALVSSFKHVDGRVYLAEVSVPDYLMAFDRPQRTVGQLSRCEKMVEEAMVSAGIRGKVVKSWAMYLIGTSVHLSYLVVVE